MSEKGNRIQDLFLGRNRHIGVRNANLFFNLGLILETTEICLI